MKNGKRLVYVVQYGIGSWAYTKKLFPVGSGSVLASKYGDKGGPERAANELCANMIANGYHARVVSYYLE